MANFEESNHDDEDDEKIVEYGVNETMPGGADHNPFDENFDSQEEAEQAGRDYMVEYPEVTRLSIFRLTIVGNTITESTTLRDMYRAELPTNSPVQRG